MKWIKTVFCIMFCCSYALGQSGAELTYFSLPVEAEQEIIPSEAYVSVNYKAIKDDLSLKSYNGTESAIVALAKLVDYIHTDNSSKYHESSLSTDSMVDNSYEFYRLFVPHSQDPKLRAITEVGDYRFLYVTLDSHFPCIIFCMRKSGNKYLNSPHLIGNTAITAMNEAVNKHLTMPDKFPFLKKALGTNTIIKFDSSMNMNTGITFYFEMKKIKFDVNDTKDTSVSYDNKYTNLLRFYRETVKDLKGDNMEGYYLKLSPESKNRITESIKESTDPVKGKDLYRQYKSSYTLVWKIIDIGQVKMLMTANGPEISYQSSDRVYIREEGNKIMVINFNRVFYLDELFRTNEMKQVLFKLDDK